MQTICYTYDAQGNQTGVTRMKDANTPITTATEYNRYGGPTTKTDPLGRKQTIGYDANFNPASVSDGLGTLGGYSFDTHGNPSTAYFGNDPQTKTGYLYDGYGNVQQTSDPLNPSANKTTYDSYDTFGHPLQMTESNATGPTRVTTMDYTALGQVWHTKVYSGNATGTLMSSSTNTYYGDGSLYRAKDELTGWTTYYTYYPDGKTKEVTNPDGAKTAYTYDWRGNKASETDTAGNTTIYTYDYAGELVKTTYADTTFTTTDYYLNGLKTSDTDARGTVTAYAYDGLDRLIEVKVKSGATTLSDTTTEYNADGSRAATVDVLKKMRTQYTYDVRGFVIQTDVIDQNQSPAKTVRTTKQSYDGVGNLLADTDSAGKVTTYSYDAANHLLSVTNPKQEKTCYTVDRSGSVLSITDPNNSQADCSLKPSGNQTTFTYDALGRTTQKTWPDNAHENYGYSVQGCGVGSMQCWAVAHTLTDSTTGTPQINTAYTDFAGRSVKLQYYGAQTPDVTYAYGANPMTLKVTVTGQRSTDYTFDSRNRITSILSTPTAPGVAPTRLDYTYDATGNRASLRLQANGSDVQKLAYAYDGLNRLCSIAPNTLTPTTCGDTTAYTLSYADAPATGITSRRTLNYPVTSGSLSVATGYDALGQIQQVTHQRNGANVATYAYTLDGMGNRTGLTEADGSTTAWGYDDAGRLLSERRTAGGNTPPAALSWDTRYGYDATGNRLRTSTLSNGQTTTTAFTYNSLDQIATASVNGVAATYSYDGGAT